jgi:chromosome partitioning protein
VNQWDKRTPATNRATEDALRELTIPLLSTRIPRSESINQAGLAYEVIFDLSPKAPGAAQLKAMARELGARAGFGSKARAA